MAATRRAPASTNRRAVGHDRVQRECDRGEQHRAPQRARQRADRGADNDAALGDQADQRVRRLDPRFGKERHVFQALHAGDHRVGDRIGAVRVRGHRQGVPVRLIHRRGQHLPRELGHVFPGAWREGPAAGHHLDDIDAVLDVLAHRRADPHGGRLGDPAQIVAVSARVVSGGPAATMDGRSARPRRPSVR